MGLPDRIRFDITWERARRLARKIFDHAWPESPTHMEVTEALLSLEIELDAQLHVIISARRLNWKQMVHDSDISSSKGVFGLLRGPAAPKLQSLQVDGSFTFDINEILDQVKSAWSEIFDRTNAPSPDAFLSEYAAEIAAMAAPCDLPEITGDDLMDQVRRRSRDAVGGLDSWRTFELQSLPLVFWNAITPLLQLAEDTGQWPESMLSINVTMLSKGEGAEPLKLRPISCASVIRASWASLRFRHIKPWLYKVCPPSVLGEPLEQVLDMALRQEEYLHGLGPSLSTMFLDKTKCFDKIVLPIWSALWTALGGPSKWSLLWKVSVAT